jgi:hypothetical protein
MSLSRPPWVLLPHFASALMCVPVLQVRLQKLAAAKAEEMKHQCIKVRAAIPRCLNWSGGFSFALIHPSQQFRPNTCLEGIAVCIQGSEPARRLRSLTSAACAPMPQALEPELQRLISGNRQEIKKRQLESHKTLNETKGQLEVENERKFQDLQRVSRVEGLCPSSCPAYDCVPTPSLPLTSHRPCTTNPLPSFTLVWESKVV